jgi:uncharacterized protein (TIGR02271 family)
MLKTDDATQLYGAPLFDENDENIGAVDELYLDDETGQPEFALIKDGGFFGGGSYFVPLNNATQTGDRLRVPYSKDKVKSAPGWDGDDHLSQQQEREIYTYYGIAYGESRSDSGLPEGKERPSVGRDVSGPTTDDAMTRSEEELHVGTAKREVGKARLRKHLVTENVTTTVPVTREEVRVEREPISDADIDTATAGPELSEEEHEVTLMTEQPVVEKRAVPKERVRLDKDTVTEQREVTESVRKEQIDLDGSDPRRDR